MASSTLKQRAPLGSGKISPAQSQPAAASSSNRSAPLRSFSLLATVLWIPSLVFIASLYTSFSDLYISPVYGSLIPTRPRELAVLSGCLWGVLVQHYYGDSRILRLRRLLPISSLFLMVVQNALSYLSGKLGTTTGPYLINFATVFPFVMLCIVCAAQTIHETNTLKKFLPFTWMIGFGAYYAILWLEPQIAGFIASLPRYSPWLSRAWIHTATSAVALVQTPREALLAAAPLLLVMLRYDVHFEWGVARKQLSTNLQRNNYRFIDRKESNTGYISILEDAEAGFRVMRCDHSLLGGEWLVTNRLIAEGVTGTEPVYTVFEMLEAVRLIETPDMKKPDREKNALVIGLGIGTAPKALLAHGVETTIVELDPVVHEFAVKYFDLPTNHTAYLEDAVGWVQTRASTPPAITYDFVLHDVFTGGAEPLPLFTETFITNLQNLLKPNGVIAINYAGTMNSQPVKQVLNTINTVFKRQCRIFCDNLPEEGDDDSTFANMVIFCLNPKSSKQARKPTFRRAVEADYLSSVSRRQFMVPKPEHELSFPTLQEMDGEKIKIMTEETMGSFTKQQLEGAVRHWRIMRKVVPGPVWESW